VIADDVSDFQIEGISIGDNLLEYFSKQEIKDNLRKNAYVDIEDKYKYYHVEFSGLSLFKTYEGIQVSYKIFDNNFFEIVFLAGAITYNDMNLCYQKQDEIIYEFKSIFEHFSEKEKKIIEYKEGKNTRLDHELNSGKIAVQCLDWNDDIPWQDHLRVSLLSNEFKEWLSNG